ncbi:Ribosomal protein S5 domain 2-type fold [Pseudocohnilembus persalinus]|uniref:Translation factor GUF1 homolog, mitochondrial n=1 Tax=Pseudocohnilembus persalinus TaxID=266149 RepID=A0A0V0QH46_PSEPJ|nr:Ribosomal protein S5 domain 2-type fold [Pseudocohnilembus persalinus]|eukprot:KRX01466.1 Ribosomal protein S5 domain 2-type fold [Pseudocohnilembus persalinus]
MDNSVQQKQEQIDKNQISQNGVQDQVSFNLNNNSTIIQKKQKQKEKEINMNLEPSQHNNILTPLSTDFYQITMCYTYFIHNRHNKNSVFEAFFRKNPFKGEYGIFAGLREVLSYVKYFKFEKEHIQFLKDYMPNARPDFFEYLESLNGSMVNISAVKEGNIVFPDEPLIRIEGPLGMVQMLETTILNLLNFPSLVATNASRIKEEAKKQICLEFGLRRAQGPDGGLMATQYSYLGGIDGTSNILGGMKFGIPVSGTMAHSFITSYKSLDEVEEYEIGNIKIKETSLKYRKQLGLQDTNDGELASFIAYASAFPDNLMVLVDTYSVHQSGVPNFLCVAFALLEAGKSPNGVRLDSGDMATQSIECKRQYKEFGEKVGLDTSKLIVVASSDIDEALLRKFNNQHHQIDAFGIGTKLVTCSDQPALGMVYKLALLEGEPKNKIVQTEPAKSTLPGKKTIYRIWTEESEYPTTDVICNEEEEIIEGQSIKLINRKMPTERYQIIPTKVEKILVDFWKNGELINKLDNLQEARTYCIQQKNVFDPKILANVDPKPYKILLTEKYYRYFQSSQDKKNGKYFPIQNIRNFNIIAHIDHGKSTLADRLLEITGCIKHGEEDSQYLDKLKVEKERGITVKAQTASMYYNYEGTQYLLNLIDTPGHIDFHYEVSRSMRCCSGSLLLVDACQGIQAQTISNYELAYIQGLKIIPVVNKIDAPAAYPEEVKQAMCEQFEIPHVNEVEAVSAKTGLNCENLLQRIIMDLPPPKVNLDGNFKGFLIDSWFVKDLGVILLFHVIDGEIKKGDQIMSCHFKKRYDIFEVGILNPEMKPTSIIHGGQVGYAVTNMKTAKDARVGDTFHILNQEVEPEEGFQEAKPMVYTGVYPDDPEEYRKLEDCIYKLAITDPAVTIQKESSAALGNGFRCGFLGLLHMDVFKQRLDDEYQISAFLTTPNVPYRALMKKHAGGKLIEIENAAQAPAVPDVVEFQEPIVEATLMFPKEYIKEMQHLCFEKRGQQVEMKMIENKKYKVKFIFPLAEIITDFFDKLKSITQGYGSIDYEHKGYQAAPIKKLTISLMGDPVDALSFMVHEDRAQSFGKSICRKLREKIPSQLFQVSIQASVGSKVIAKEIIKAVGKNVTAKCYGGDYSRKKKLLERQKEAQNQQKLKEQEEQNSLEVDPLVYNYPLLLIPFEKPIFPNNILVTQVSKKFCQFIKDNDIQYVGAFTLKDGAQATNLIDLYENQDQKEKILDTNKIVTQRNNLNKQFLKIKGQVYKGNQKMKERIENNFYQTPYQASYNPDTAFQVNIQDTYYYQNGLKGIQNINDIYRDGTICAIKFEVYVEQGQKQLVAFLRGIKRIQAIQESNTFVYLSDRREVTKNDKKILQNQKNSIDSEKLDELDDQEDELQITSQDIYELEQEKKEQSQHQFLNNQDVLSQVVRNVNAVKQSVENKVTEHNQYHLVGNHEDQNIQKKQINFLKVLPIRSHSQNIQGDQKYQQMVLNMLNQFDQFRKRFPINVSNIADKMLAESAIDVICGFLSQSNFFSKEQVMKLFQTEFDYQKLNLCLQYFEMYKKELEQSKLLEQVNQAQITPENNYKQIYNFLRPHFESPAITAQADKFQEIKDSLTLPTKIEKIFDEELANFREMDEQHTDYDSSKQLLEIITSLPWGVTTEDNFNLQKAKKILDKHHYGMEEVKNRILEFIAVSKLKGNVKGRGILLLGPPGTGKTSVASSIAECLGRKFQRISMGGESDVAIIKGHRKTYLGSYPGKIVKAFQSAKSENPVILIDEIEKTGTGQKGNVQHALLEVLDPEQNNKFVDNFLEFEIDLSKVLFVCSANLLETMHPALLDRLDLIELSGYTSQEKKEIFKRHILPKAMEKTGIDKQKDLNVKITEDGIDKLIVEYAREPGMRNLERKTKKIFEKVALKLEAGTLKLDNQEEVDQYEEKLQKLKQEQQQQQENDHKNIENQQIQSKNKIQNLKKVVKQLEINKKNLKDYVGLPTFSSNKLYGANLPVGVIRGLAYNSYGGSMIFIESTVIQGQNQQQNQIDEKKIDENDQQSDVIEINNDSIDSVVQQDQNKNKNQKQGGHLQYTGQLGKVMKESVEIAYSNVKNYLYSLDEKQVPFPIVKNFYQENNIHIHFTDGATPKDGPSAGISVASALFSLAINRPIKKQIAMTGELSATGKVLKIGGVREKILAAKREDIHTVILPLQNKADFEQLRDEIKEGVTPLFANTLDDVFKILFFDSDNEQQK